KLPYPNITWTMVVTNNGPLVDTGVTVNDVMPANNTYVSSQTTKGSCTGGAALSCDLGTLDVGESVTITLVTNPTKTGLQVNTANVSGDLEETTLANNSASAQVKVIPIFTPPCTNITVKPSRYIWTGRTTTLHIKVAQKGVPQAGVRVRITGPGIFVITK